MEFLIKVSGKNDLVSFEVLVIGGSRVEMFIYRFELKIIMVSSKGVSGMMVCSVGLIIDRWCLNVVEGVWFSICQFLQVVSNSKVSVKGVR